MSSSSRPCHPEQPMYCKKELSRQYKQSKGILPAEDLINSPRMEIMDASNLSSDPNIKIVGKDRYCNGFYPAGCDLACPVMIYSLGFFKRIWPDRNQPNEKGKKILGIARPFLSCIYASNQAFDAGLPETGKAVCIKFTGVPVSNFDCEVRQ